MSTKSSIDGHTVQRLHTVTEPQVRGLAELLIDCVDGGASVSFMHPLPSEKAQDFWRRAAHRVAIVWDAHSIVSVCPRLFDGRLVVHGGSCTTVDADELRAGVLHGPRPGGEARVARGVAEAGTVVEVQVASPAAPSDGAA